MIKFMKHYVTDGKVKARVHYNRGVLRDGRMCVTLYAKDYDRNLEQIFPETENNSDMMTDYFEKSRVRIFPADENWSAALARCS